MFGKSLSEYVAFQKPILILITAVWALRLLLSVAGVPVAGVQFLSVTGVLVLGALHYAWAVGQKRFGSFKQLYGLNLVQGLFSQTLVALAIVLATVTGQDNIYSIPEFYPPAQGIGVLGLPLPPDGKSSATRSNISWWRVGSASRSSAGCWDRSCWSQHARSPPGLA